MTNDWGVILSPVAAVGVPIRTLLTDYEHYRLTKLAEVEGNFIDLEAEYFLAPDGKPIRDRTYFARLNPAQSWMAVRSGIRRDANEAADEIELADDTDFGLFPQKVVTTWSWAATAKQDVIVFEFEKPEPCALPAEAFYLPHYDISEGVLETLSPDPWPRWLLVLAGMLSLIVGFWLLFRRRRPTEQA